MKWRYKSKCYNNNGYYHYFYYIIIIFIIIIIIILIVRWITRNRRLGRGLKPDVSPCSVKTSLAALPQEARKNGWIRSQAWRLSLTKSLSVTRKWFIFVSLFIRVTQETRWLWWYMSQQHKGCTIGNVKSGGGGFQKRKKILHSGYFWPHPSHF